MIDNHPPATYGHLQINFKKLQMREVQPKLYNYSDHNT